MAALLAAGLAEVSRSTAIMLLGRGVEVSRVVARSAWRNGGYRWFARPEDVVASGRAVLKHPVTVTR